MNRVVNTLLSIFVVALLLVMLAGLAAGSFNRARRPPEAAPSHAEPVAALEPVAAEATPNGLLMKSGPAEIAVMTSVIICEPPFRHKYWYNIEGETYPVEFVNTAEKAEIVQVGDKSVVDVKEYSVTQEESGSALLTLVAEKVADLPVDLEHTLFVAPEYLLAGANYRAVLDDGEEVTGSIPEVYEGAPEVRHVFERAKFAELENAYGKLTLEVVEGPPFLIGDRRGVVFEGRRCFWLGHQVPLELDQPYRSVTRISYAPSPAITYAEPLTAPEGATAAVEEAADLSADYVPAYPLYPAPRAAEFREGTPFDLARNLELESNSSDPRLDRAVEKILLANADANADASAKLRVVIGESGEGILIPPDNDEGYILNVTEDELTILARKEVGAFRALQTVRQLKRNGKVPQLLIRDWPDMEMRGVHYMLPDADAYELLSRMVTEVLVPMKMNTLFLECEFVKWECIPELHASWGMPKEDCEKLIALCEENFIEPLPLLQTLSHIPWMFRYGQNLDMCEDPANPYCYFTSHPGVYPFIEKVLNEVVETFHHPRYIHIGHDELYTWAKFPNRPESIAKGAPKIVYDDVMWHYEYAKKHNAQIMMWHDIFVTKEESTENGHGGGNPDWVDTIRPDLPRDIVFAVWRYAGDHQDFIDLEHLAAEGFEVVGSSWFETNNVENLTRAAKQVGALGMLSTTWIYPEVSGDRIVHGCFDALERWFLQLAPYVRSGVWSWNCNNYANRDLNGKELFCDLLEPSRNTGSAAGETIDISQFANLPMNAAGNPFLTGNLHGFDRLPRGKVRIGRVLFDIPEKDGAPAAVALKSRLNPKFPSEVKIPLAKPLEAEKLYFLHTPKGIQPSPKSVLAEYVLEYEDGSVATLPVLYQFSAANPEEDVNYLLSTGNRIAWRDGVQPMNLWYAGFDNPMPEKAVTAITLKGTEEEFPFYLFGISAEK